jgi:hypothetical protein
VTRVHVCIPCAYIHHIHTYAEPVNVNTHTRTYVYIKHVLHTCPQIQPEPYRNLCTPGTYSDFGAHTYIHICVHTYVLHAYTHRSSPCRTKLYVLQAPISISEHAHTYIYVYIHMFYTHTLTDPARAVPNSMYTGHLQRFWSFQVFHMRSRVSVSRSWCK